MAVFKPYSSNWDDEKENVYGYEYDDEQYPHNMHSLSVVNPDGNFANVLSQFEVNDMGVNFSTSNHRRVLKVWELEILYNKALNHYPASHYKPVNVLYRDKPGDFFRKALNADNGFMKSYPKDQGGDPRSPINGQLDGLFFACNVEWDGMPPKTSFFGNTRLTVPASFIFSPVSRYSYHSEGSCPVRLYFTDFYCMRGSGHWATLVMTYKGSFADKFCERRLLELDLATNELLTVGEDGVFMRDSNLSLEIFYASDVDLNHWLAFGAEIEDVQTAGKGSSTVGGLSKNILCEKCGLL